MRCWIAPSSRFSYDMAAIALASAATTRRAKTAMATTIKKTATAKAKPATKASEKQEVAIAVRINDLKKRYQHKQQWALDGVNLAVRKGEFFGLLGPNGCGKTTLISILSGLVSATSGEVLLHDIAAHKYLRQHPRYFGLVPQELALYPTLTIRENMEFFAKMYGYSGRTLRARVADCLQLAALDHCGKQLVGRFSGGMKRRANLALSLLHEPKLLILDEPTVNVDPQSRNMIFDALGELHKSGTTLIYTTHYLEEAQQLCERVAIIDHGRVLCCDTPKHLIDKTAGASDLGQVFLELTGSELRD